MTRPDPAAITIAAAGAIWTGLFIVAGWTVAAGIAAGCTAAAAILFWHVPLCEDGGDIDALIEATREQHPRYADWDTRELTP
jgi:hypothetical protein